MELWKQGWKGKWETNTEIMKRHLFKREKAIKEELEHFAKVRAQHRQSRNRKGIQTVWVVGYTNAWKSTLTNILTKKWVLAEDKLFATLWTSVWKMFIEASYDEKTNTYIPPKEVLINDTIWFIRELPPKLIDAFKSTLEDSIESDLLLHVIDSLESIWANQKRLYVFNKIDWLEQKEYIEKIEEYIDWEKQVKEVVYKNKVEYLKQKYSDKNPIFISAGKNIWIKELKKKIIEEL